MRICVLMFMNACAVCMWKRVRGRGSPWHSTTTRCRWTVSLRRFDALLASRSLVRSPLPPVFWHCQVLGVRLDVKDTGRKGGQMDFRGGGQKRDMYRVWGSIIGTSRERAHLPSRRLIGEELMDASPSGAGWFHLTFFAVSAVSAGPKVDPFAMSISSRASSWIVAGPTASPVFLERSAVCRHSPSTPLKSSASFSFSCSTV